MTHAETNIGVATVFEYVVTLKDFGSATITILLRPSWRRCTKSLTKGLRTPYTFTQQGLYRHSYLPSTSRGFPQRNIQEVLATSWHLMDIPPYESRHIESTLCVSRCTIGLLYPKAWKSYVVRAVLGLGLTQCGGGCHHYRPLVESNPSQRMTFVTKYSLVADMKLSKVLSRKDIVFCGARSGEHVLNAFSGIANMKEEWVSAVSTRHIHH